MSETPSMYEEEQVPFETKTGRGRKRKSQTRKPSSSTEPTCDTQCDNDDEVKRKLPTLYEDVPEVISALEPDVPENAVPPNMEHKVVPAPDGMDFVVKIALPQAFKTLIEIIGHILQDCHFTVISTEDFQGLVVNSFDASKCCMIAAKFACDAKVRSGVTHHFCVKMNIMNSLLKSVDPRLCLEISRSIGASDVTIIASDGYVGNIQHNVQETRYQEFVLNTLDREPDSDTIDKFNCDYTVEIRLTEFKNLVKMAKDFNSQDLRFQISEPLEHGPVRCSYLVLSVNGSDAKCKHVYISTTDWGEQVDTVHGVIIRTCDQTPSHYKRMPDQNLLKKCLDKAFSTTYLNNFLISMKKETLTMRLSSDGAPMVLYYSLNEESHVSFVLAPLAENDN
jgi:hypothetical protein